MRIFELMDRVPKVPNEGGDLYHQLDGSKSGVLGCLFNLIHVLSRYYGCLVKLIRNYFCLCENKGADQRLCFCYTDSTISLLLKSKISSF